jgi:predicted Zn finger-like uncharacterized protein
MRVTCPHCAALYEIPDILAARPRRMHCACCDTVWKTDALPAPATEWEVLPDPVAEPERAADEPPLRTPEPPISQETNRPRPVEVAVTPPFGGPRFWMVAWAGSAVLMVGTCAACWRWQLPLSHAWPPLARLFAGLHAVF